MSPQGFQNRFIALHRRKIPLVDGFARISLLDDAQNTFVQVLVKVLRVAERAGTRRAFARGVSRIARRNARTSATHAIRRLSGRGPLAAVRRCLLHVVDVSQVPLEHIRSVERLFGGRSRAWTKIAHHCPFIMGQCVPILVVFPGEPTPMKLAAFDRTFFRTFALMGQGVGFEIFEHLAAVRIGAAATLFAFSVRLTRTMRTVEARLCSRSRRRGWHAANLAWRRRMTPHACCIRAIRMDRR